MMQQLKFYVKITVVITDWFGQAMKIIEGLKYIRIIGSDHGLMMNRDW